MIQEYMAIIKSDVENTQDTYDKTYHMFCNLIITDSPYSAEHERYCEETIISCYKDVWKEHLESKPGEILPSFTEICDRAWNCNYELFTRMAEMEMEVEYDVVYMDEDEINEIIDEKVLSINENFSYNMCHNFDSYVAEVLNKYRLVYTLDESDSVFSDLDGNVLRIAQQLLATQDDYKIVANDCQNVLVPQLRVEGVGGYKTYLYAENPYNKPNNLLTYSYTKRVLTNEQPYQLEYK